MDTLDPRRTALVLIDLQAGIARLPVAPHPAAEVIARGNRLAAGLRAARGTVVLVRVAWSPDFGDGLKQPVDLSHPLEIGPDWADPAPGLEQAAGDIVIVKRQWGAFHGTELDLQLRRRRVDTILLGGIATNMGVESTARAAWEHGYALVTVEDACSGLDADMHAFAMNAILKMIGRVRSTADVLAAL